VTRLDARNDKNHMQVFAIVRIGAFPVVVGILCRYDSAPIAEDHMPRWFVQISVSAVLGVLAITCPRYMQAQPGPIPSLRRWVDASTLIIKGRVLRTHEMPGESEGPPRSHRSLATVQIESFLKGRVGGSEIAIEFPELTNPPGNTVYQSFYSLHPGDTGILFLKRDQDGRWIFANSDQGLLHTVQNTPAAEMAITTMSKLEAELIATVSDRLYGPEAASLLDTLEFLDARECPASAALREDTNPENPAILRVHAYATSIRCGGYSTLSQAIDLAEKLTFTRRSQKQQFDLGEAIGEIGDNRLLQVMKQDGYKHTEVCASRSKVPFDNSALPQLHRVLFSWNEDLRRGAADALRGICDPASAPHLANALDLADLDVQYEAMMGLAALEGFPKDRAAPTFVAFKSNPATYLSPWRNWWSSAGEQKYRAGTYDKVLRLQGTVRAGTADMVVGGSVGLTITNLSSRPVTIERRIRREYQTASGWTGTYDMEAVSKCETYDPNFLDWKAQVQIDAHATLTVVPWDGWICGGQCPIACMQNVPAMPGTYRFVLVTVPDARRIISPKFSMSRCDKGTFSCFQPVAPASLPTKSPDNSR
jgi:hypothetical protein